MANINWRTINIDALDPDSPANFDLKTLTPAVAPVSTADVQNLASQIRQLLRGGDSEGALRGALETAPYGADERGKVSSPISLRTGGFAVLPRHQSGRSVAQELNNGLPGVLVPAICCLRSAADGICTGTSPRDRD